MCKVVVFAGTSEGRQICDWLAERNVTVCMCVATEYGKELAGAKENIQVHAENMDAEKMCQFIEACSFIVDATHPYAVQATQNIKNACKATEKQYYRLLRPAGKSEGCVVVDSAKQAVEYLKDKEGNVLLTTGSKGLAAYGELEVCRLYPRVLPKKESLEQCALLGVPQKNIICMQGPFSVHLNRAVIEEINAKFLVTKNSGDVGGYREKVEAAKQAGAIVVVIGRPSDETGYEIGRLKRLLSKQHQI